MPRSKTEIVQRLARHRPIAGPVARRKVWVRWAATLAMICLLPLAAMLVGFGGVHNYMFIGIAIGMVGVAGLVVAWLAASKFDAAENQWGLAALTPKECHELHELSGVDDRVQDIVDHWLDVWISTGQCPRGRDLALLRRMVAGWHDAPEEAKSSWRARHGFARIKRPPSESSMSDMIR